MKKDLTYTTITCDYKQFKLSESSSSRFVCATFPGIRKQTVVIGFLKSCKQK